MIKTLNFTLVTLLYLATVLVVFNFDNTQTTTCDYHSECSINKTIISTDSQVEKESFFLLLNHAHCYTSFFSNYIGSVQKNLVNPHSHESISLSMHFRI
jgi:hypothetical protein